MCKSFWLKELWMFMDMPARPIFTHGHHWHQQVLLLFYASVNPIWHYPTNSLKISFIGPEIW